MACRTFFSWAQKDRKAIAMAEALALWQRNVDVGFMLGCRDGDWETQTRAQMGSKW